MTYLCASESHVLGPYELTVFRSPKAGEGVCDSEDQFAWRVDGDRLLVGLSDGASTSTLPAAWAATLVDEFCHEVGADAVMTGDLRPLLVSARNRHASFVQQRVTALGAATARTERRIRALTERAAAATFLGVSVSAGNPTDWRVVAVGDTCVLRVGHPSGLTSWPISTPQGFSSTPPLLLSHDTGDSQEQRATLLTASGAAEEEIYLATDALARALLADPRRLAEWTSAGVGRWYREVARARARGELEDDDATLIRIRVASVSESAPATSIGRRADGRVAPPSLGRQSEAPVGDDGRRGTLRRLATLAGALVLGGILGALAVSRLPGSDDLAQMASSSGGVSTESTARDDSHSATTFAAGGREFVLVRPSDALVCCTARVAPPYCRPVARSEGHPAVDAEAVWIEVMDWVNRLPVRPPVTDVCTVVVRPGP